MDNFKNYYGIKITYVLFAYKQTVELDVEQSN